MWRAGAPRGPKRSPEPVTSGAGTEDLLLSRWRAGDRAAGNDLVRMCKPFLRSYFRRRTSENIDELMQRTLVACIQALDRFEGRSSFRSFLLGIAHKQFLMSLRSKRPRAVATSLETHPERPCPPEDCPSQLLATKEDVRTVAAALNDTPPTFRRVLEMFYWDDLSVDEIAKTLDLPIGTVKSRLARGRSAIKARIVEAARPATSGARVVRKGNDFLLLVQDRSHATHGRMAAFSFRQPALFQVPRAEAARREHHQPPQPRGDFREPAMPTG
jgi:RNA polymerase sigma factor (sigma-70 family)